MLQGNVCECTLIRKILEHFLLGTIPDIQHIANDCCKFANGCHS